MKIIDLLNLIAKGEEVPKKIKYDGMIFDYQEDTYEYLCYEENNFSLLGYDNPYDMLNDNVEIIEEEKEIEKLDVALLGQCDNWLQDQVTGEKSRLELNPYIINNIRENTLYFQKKINQIIDLINDMRDKDE